MAKFVVVNSSEVFNTCTNPSLNLSAEYWIKRKRIEKELEDLCIFSDQEKAVILKNL